MGNEDWNDGPTNAAIPAELAKTPEERVSEARSAWRDALGLGTEEALHRAALKLRQAQAWEDAIQAYALLGERFASARALAAHGAGDCFLFSVYARAGVPTELRVRALESALGWYDSALAHGATPGRIEDGYWSACEMLAEACAAERPRQLEVLARYRRAFPHGSHRTEADRRARGA